MNSITNACIAKMTAVLTSLMVLFMSLLAVSRSSGRALFNNLAKS